jgi:hypothetical protein
MDRADLSALARRLLDCILLGRPGFDASIASPPTYRTLPTIRSRKWWMAEGQPGGEQPVLVLRGATSSTSLPRRCAHLYPRSGSNRHLNPFKGFASANWATGARG